MNDRLPCFFSPRWPVLYEDNHLLGLYKPSGLLVQGDQTGDESLLELAKKWIKQRYDKPGRVFLAMVHRLDRPVAGVVLFCRTSKAAARISAQFREKTVEKQYLAVLEGDLERPGGTLVHRMVRMKHGSSRIVAGKEPESREARLFYRLLDRRDGKSLVEIDLETGRHHQIRAQFGYIGHPVMGDLRYGASAPMPDKQVALFARSLSVLHPVSGERLHLACTLPEGWPWPGETDRPQGPPWHWRILNNTQTDRFKYLKK